jgi:hypothetical protein
MFARLHVCDFFCTFAGYFVEICIKSNKNYKNTNYGYSTTKHRYLVQRPYIG